MAWAATRAAGEPRSGSRIATSKPSRLAAAASMRPSWPPPRMPMVWPGASGRTVMRSSGVLDRLGDTGGLPRGELGDALGHCLVAGAQDAGGEQGGVLRPRLAD